MADIRISDLPDNPGVNPNEFIATDLSATRKATIQQIVDAGIPIATQADAEGGTNNIKRMTPLTTKQQIDSRIGTGAGTIAAGNDARIVNSLNRLGDTTAIGSVMSFPTVRLGTDDNQNLSNIAMIGGADPANNPNGLLMLLDAYDAWISPMPSRLGTTIEWALYSRARAGTCMPQIGTNRANFVGGEGWYYSQPSPVGRYVYVKKRKLRVSAFVPGTSGYFEVTNIDGSPFTFTVPDYTAGVAVFWDATTPWGTGTCNVAPRTGGSLVTRVLGTKFPPFGQNYKLVIDGTVVTLDTGRPGGPFIFNPTTKSIDVAITETITKSNVAYEWSYQSEHGAVSIFNVHAHTGAHGGEENFYVYSTPWGAMMGAGGAGAGDPNFPLLLVSGIKANSGINHPSKAPFEYRTHIDLRPSDDGLSLGGLQGEEAVRVVQQSNAVNRIEAAGAITGLGPTLRVRGSDANIRFSYDAKGAGDHLFTAYDYGAIAFNAAALSGANNYLKALGTTGNPELQALGAGANLFLVLRGKGTGLPSSVSGHAVDGTKVIGARDTGWAADTGTAKKTANATYSGTASATYSQAEMTAVMNALRDATQTIKAMKDAMISHGLIG